MSSKRIERLPRFAETRFANLCAAYGATATKTDEDENGWDYFVEFPAKTSTRLADQQPPSNTAYIQVKSTRSKTPTCRIKVSNALKAAQSRQPWFVILFALPVESECPRIYVTHVWESLMSKILAAVRRAVVDKSQLHRREISIKFSSADDKTEDLLTWMESAIDGVGASYESQKNLIFENIGYEKGYATGQLQVSAQSDDEILDNLLGLGRGLTVEYFTYTPTRFGIPLNEPEASFNSGTVHITPEPIGQARITLRGPDVSSQISIEAQVFVADLPDSAERKTRFRFSAEYIDVIWSGSGSGRCDLSLDHDRKMDLQTIQEYATIHSWGHMGPVEVQIWFKGSRVLSGTTEMEQGKQYDGWPKIRDITTTLRQICSPSDERIIRLSIRQIAQKFSDLHLVSQAISPSVFLLDLVPPTPLPERIDILLYYLEVQVGSYVFYVLMERPFRHEGESDGRRRIVFGKPTIREMYVLQDPTDQQRQQMADDYERYFNESAKSMNPIGLRNLKEFLHTSILEFEDSQA